MSPSPLASWRGLEWRILSAGPGPFYDEASTILSNGLSALGLRAAPAGRDGPGGGAIIILNATGSGGGQGYAIRSGEERVEIFGDSETALPFAAAAFVEAMGAKALSPRLERFVDPPGFTGKVLRSAPAFPSRALVFREPLLPETREEWKGWAIRRGFDSLDGPGAEYPLSGGRIAYEAALRTTGESPMTAKDARLPAVSRGPVAIADLNVPSAIEAIRSLQRAHDPERSLCVLMRAGGFPGFVEAFMRDGSGNKPFIVIDSGERCRAHALADPDCERNVALFGERFSQAAARWKDSGGLLGLRLRYDDDELFPAPCPPQARLIERDMEWAAERGCVALEYVASARLPDRPSINAWVFSSLAFPPPRAKGETQGDPESAARSSFFSAMAGKESPSDPDDGASSSTEGISEYYALLEEALAAAFDRGLGADAGAEESLGPEGPPRGRSKELLASLPASAIDPWDEALERQEERAQALSDAYPKLDRCAELLRTMEEGESAAGISAAREADAFRALEAAIELSGVMRALYAEAKRESGAPATLAMVADGALLALGRRIEALFPGRKPPAAARRFLMSAYRFRILNLYYVNARGPVAKLRALAFRAALSLGFDRLSHPER